MLVVFDYRIKPCPALNSRVWLFTSFIETDPVFLNFIYSYHYDAHKRMIASALVDVYDRHKPVCMCAVSLADGIQTRSLRSFAAGRKLLFRLPPAFVLPDSDAAREKREYGKEFRLV